MTGLVLADHSARTWSVTIHFPIAVTPCLRMTKTATGSGYTLLHDVQQQRHASSLGRGPLNKTHRNHHLGAGNSGRHIRRASPLNSHTNMLCRQADGGAERDRTDDLLLAKQALSQLSYSPRSRKRSISAIDRKRWWAREDLNFRPHAYQARALTN